MSHTAVRARTQHDKEQKRRKLMSAAMELFVERGYKTPTVEMITERAGTSVGTFYLYFRGKREIYRVFQSEAMDILSVMVFQGLTGRHETAREKLTAAAAAYLHFYREYPEYYAFIALIDPNDPDEPREGESHIGKLVIVTTLAILHRVEEVIVDGIRTGEFRTVDPWKTACALWGMIDGFILMEERNNTRIIDMTLDELIEQGLQTAFTGIMRADATAAGDIDDGTATGRHRPS